MPTKKTPRKPASPTAERPHMPGYGLSTSGRGLLPWKWARDRLTRSHNYWMVTTAAHFRKFGYFQKSWTIQTLPVAMV